MATADAAATAGGEFMSEPDEDLELEGLRPEFFREHSDATGTARPDLWWHGVTDFAKLQTDAHFQWVPVGPAPLIIEPDAPLQDTQGVGPDAGFVADIAIDPSGADDTTIYIATSDGGIWKSDNAGVTWSPKAEFLQSLGMRVVALDPVTPSIVYAGTGNMFGASFWLPNVKNIGIYKSVDGGETWRLTDGGLFGSLIAQQQINRLLVIAADTLLVATDLGLYRSADGGATFQPVGLSNGGAAIPLPRVTWLVQDTTNATTIYACVAGVGVLQSTDGGQSFPTNLSSLPGFAPAPFGDIVLAQAMPPNNKTMYASVQYTPPGGTPTYVGLYKLINNGTAWSVLGDAKLRADQDSAAQTNYDLTVGVDPQNANLVYIGFQELWRSQDGQTFPSEPALAPATFVPAPGAIACTRRKVHFDHHTIAFSPQPHWAARPGQPTRVWVGTDGGLAKSEDAGVTWTAMNAGVSTNLFRGIDIGRGAKNGYTYGGTQDTGTSGHRPADAPDPADNSFEWHSGINGDGGVVAVDAATPKTIYGFDNEFFIVSTDRGRTWQLSQPPGGGGAPPVGQGLTNPPNTPRRVAVDPNNGGTLVVSEGAQLYRGTDAGVHFTPLQASPASSPFAANVTAITAPAADSHRLWVGLEDGTVHFSNDTGVTWDTAPLATSPGPRGPVTGIAVDPHDINRVVVAYAGHSEINPVYKTRHVFLSPDNGASWADISGTDGSGPTGNLPDLPLASIAFDRNTNPSTILVSCDGGVMRSKDNGASWQALGVGLPLVQCTSLAVDDTVSPGLVRVSTYGRSCFELMTQASQKIAVRGNLAFGLVPSGGGSATLALEIFNVGGAPLNVTGIAPSGGGADFQITPAPALPATLQPGDRLGVPVKFQPTSNGAKTETFSIQSDDPLEPTVSTAASGSGVAAAGSPRLVVDANLGFGLVMGGQHRNLPLRLLNTGAVPLQINNVTRVVGDSDFSLDSPPSFPATIPAGGSLDLTAKFAPDSNGPRSARFEVQSDDPRGARLIPAKGEATSVSSETLKIVLIIIGAALVIGAGVLIAEEA